MRLERRKNIALLFVVNEDTNPRWDLIQPDVRAKNLHDELEFSGGGWWDVSVEPYKIIVPENFRIHYQSMDWEYLWDRLAEINPHHQHNYIHVQGGGGSATVAGMADLSGPHAWTGSGSHHTRVHEQGHAHGFGHDSRGSSVYGGPSRMGHRGFAFNAINMSETGFFKPSKGNGYYYIVYPDTRTNETKLIETDFGKVCLQRGHMPTLYIYHPKSNIYTRVEDSLKPGESSSKFPVKFLRMVEGLAEVQIGNARKTPVPSLSSNAQSPLEESKAGIWHNRNHTHQGFVFDVRRNKETNQWEVVLYWFTHGEKNPRWFWVVAPIESDVAEGELWTTYDRKESKVGRAAMSFDSDQTGQIYFWLDDLDFLLKGRGRINLTKLADKGNSELNGLWGFKNREREGLFVTAGGEIKYHFGYDGLSQSWFFGDKGKLYVPIGGYPFISTSSTVQRFGTYTLTKDEFKTDGDTYPLERLV